MTKNNSCERIQYVRNYYQLNQTDFSAEIGMSQSNYSKIELGKTKPSTTVLYALMARFAVNPNWVKTGQGEMLLSPDEYLANGVKLLGSQKISEGLIRFLKDPAFGEVKSLVAVGELVKDNHGQDLEVYLQYILNKWYQGDEKEKHWLLKQLELAFIEVKKKS